MLFIQCAQIQDQDSGRKPVENVLVVVVVVVVVAQECMIVNTATRQAESS